MPRLRHGNNSVNQQQHLGANTNNSNTSNNNSSSGYVSNKTALSQGPSKEDILSALDQFGDKALQKTANGKVTSPPKNDGQGEISEGKISVSHGTSNESLDEWDRIDTDYAPESVSFSSSYSGEWCKLFTKPNYLKILREHGLKGNLRSSRFRSICWKLYLEVLPEDINQWVQKSKEWRLKYHDLKDMLIVNPRKAVDTADLCLNNPLSQADESPWNKFFQDNELRLTIKQDVIRTYPKIEFFQSNQLRNMMVDILFIYAKIKPDIVYRQIYISRKMVEAYTPFDDLQYTFLIIPPGYHVFPEVEFFHSSSIQELLINVLFCYSRIYNLGYRQGMHELLAPLIFVLHCDHQAFLHACEIESIEDIVKVVMDPDYLEHDAYYMFCQVMDTVEPWYMSKEMSVSKGCMLSPPPFARLQDLHPSNAVVSKLTRIQDYVLKKHDQELHIHLERLDIAPQIYGIRWVRLLFGREFPMQDLLVIWDAIFSDSIGFDLVDFVFVAMLLYIRDLLLSSDYTSSLSILMHYPPVGDVHYFIDKAVWLREPNMYNRPPNYTYENVNNVSIKRVSNKPGHYGERVIQSFSSFSRKMASSARPEHLPISANSKKMPKSSSEPMNLQTDISPVNAQDIMNKRKGSTQSLSRIEHSAGTIQSTPSAASLARLETTSLRSYDSSPCPMTPEDVTSPMGNPNRGKSSTLPRPRSRSKKLSKAEHELLSQNAYLQGQLHDTSEMSSYCASKLDVHISRLQNQLLRQNLEGEDEIYLAIAGVKQVRDILKGTLKFSQNLLDSDEINIRENHYRVDTSSETSPDVDSSTSQSVTSPDVSHDPVNSSAISSCDAGQELTSQKPNQGLFYMSSDEKSEESPTQSVDEAKSYGAKQLQSKPDQSGDKQTRRKDFELGSFREPLRRKSQEMCGQQADDILSEIATSSNLSSVCSSPERQRDDNVILEESPNLLYRSETFDMNC